MDVLFRSHLFRLSPRPLFLYQQEESAEDAIAPVAQTTALPIGSTVLNAQHPLSPPLDFGVVEIVAIHAAILALLVLAVHLYTFRRRLRETTYVSLVCGTAVSVLYFSLLLAVLALAYLFVLAGVYYYTYIVYVLASVLLAFVIVNFACALAFCIKTKSFIPLFSNGSQFIVVDLVARRIVVPFYGDDTTLTINRTPFILDVSGFILKSEFSEVMPNSLRIISLHMAYSMRLSDTVVYVDGETHLYALCSQRDSNTIVNMCAVDVRT